MTKRIFFVAYALLLMGCTRVTIPTQPTNNLPDFPSNTPIATNRIRIELRVTGNASSVRVRTSNPEDGLAQIVTTLPYVSSFDTRESDLFISLEATPLSYSSLVQFPFLAIQIFADGKLFREASSSEFFLNTLSVSGTWRR